MNKESLTIQLNNKGYSTIQIQELSLCRTHKDADDAPFYERDRLLQIFRGRLRGCLANDPNNEMIPFLQQSIEDLVAIPPESPIYFWECLANGDRVVGRSTCERILHIYPSSSA